MARKQSNIVLPALPEGSSLFGLHDYVLNTEHLYGFFKDGIGRAASLGFIVNNSSIKGQLASDFKSKLQLHNERKIKDLHCDIEHAMVDMKYYVHDLLASYRDNFNSGNNEVANTRLFNNELRNTIDFLLDFTVVSALSEFPLYNNFNGESSRSIADVGHFIVMDYLAWNMRNVSKHVKNKSDTMSALSNKVKDYKDLFCNLMKGPSLRYCDLVAISHESVQGYVPGLITCIERMGSWMMRGSKVKDKLPPHMMPVLAENLYLLQKSKIIHDALCVDDISARLISEPYKG